MEILTIFLVTGVTFGVCFLLDRLFTRLFRGKAQHSSGLSVRLNKHYASFGLILGVIGVAGVLGGIEDSTVMLVGGIIVLLIGAGLVIYYMTYGIFYDEDSFLYTAFGRKSLQYAYRDIAAQQLYVLQGGNILVELYMTDGGTVQVQLRMQGAETFLDKAYRGWCRQKGLDPQSCTFYDPQNSCWFPPVEEM